MIWQLMKRDPAWRWIIALTLLIGAFCVAWPFLSVDADAGGRLIFISAFAVLPIAAGVAVPLQQGDTGLLAILPVTVRQIYLARALSMAGLLWIPFAVSAITLALSRTAAPVVTLLEFTSVLTLAMLGIQSAAIRGFAMPRVLVTAPIFLWILGAGLTPIFGDRGGEFPLLICWIAFAGVFARTWQTVPRSFQSAPLKLSPARRTGIESARGRRRAIPWIPVPGTMLIGGGLQLLILFLFMAWSNLRPYMFIMLFAGNWQTLRPRVRWLFALPVPRRVLLAAILLPILLTFEGGYLVSVHLPSTPTPYVRGIAIRASQEVNGHRIPDCKTPNVVPSWDFWIRVKDGKAPLIQAPWGETFQPPVIRRSGFPVFNPYAVGCDNSKRFLDWQFNRATLAVYGQVLPRDNDGGMMTGHVVITSIRTQFVTVVAIAGIGILAMIVSAGNDWQRLRRITSPVRITLLSLTVAAFGAVILLDVSDKLNLVQWLSWALPQNLAAVIAVTVPALALLYWALDTLFKQIELVDKVAALTA